MYLFLFPSPPLFPFPPYFVSLFFTFSHFCPFLLPFLFFILVRGLFSVIFPHCSPSPIPFPGPFFSFLLSPSFSSCSLAVFSSFSLFLLFLTLRLLPHTLSLIPFSLEHPPFYLLPRFPLPVCSLFLLFIPFFPLPASCFFLPLSHLFLHPFPLSFPYLLPVSSSLSTACFLVSPFLSSPACFPSLPFSLSSAYLPSSPPPLSSSFEQRPQQQQLIPPPRWRLPSAVSPPDLGPARQPPQRRPQLHFRRISESQDAALDRKLNHQFGHLGALRTVEPLHAGSQPPGPVEYLPARLHGPTHPAQPVRMARNLSHNEIQNLADGTFSGLSSLLSLDVRSNRVAVMGSRVFSSLGKLDHLWTDEFRFCCLARGVGQCHPPPDEFSSCEDLMSNIMLRVSVWVLGTLALSGNFIVIVWRIYESDNKVHSFLITNLALGDLCMGFYLIIIAAVDVNYRGVYFIYDAIWRSSSLCQLAGFFSTFSSELSVFTLTVITLERFSVIIFPFRTTRLNMQWTKIIMGVVWACVGVLAALPLADIHYFRNFYGRSGVCLALHITHEKPSGWEYSVFVFLVLNFLSFSVIAASYWGMYRAARTSSAAVRNDHQRRESNMAKRMTAIVVTDAACWMPIILLGIVSLAGVRIPPQVCVCV
ncbi:G-protein coupled receptor [Penaeus vannamei]|uniref:G-protein coupled receptor n=1 Tax=Penaeus vannamei TaxID=6689 RepID=A0A3R7PT26_PENVA|nr:G-protein coupled receptor [Penaeus vannamei]